MRTQILHGDCRELLRTLPDASVEAVVTDPPAGIAFMGKEWDRDKGGRDAWIAWLTDILRECYRVAKPGAHAVVWALPRTSGWTHRALEDAGWEVRDCITHLTGQGFPKSFDVSKAIDKMHRRDYVLAAIDLGLEIPGNNLHDWTKAEHSPGDEWWEKFKAHLSDEDWQRIERKVIGSDTKARSTSGKSALPTLGGQTVYETWDITAPATPEAERWQGWGTALKPGAEFWYLARKPLAAKTVAANVLSYGTGALNIDATRIPADGEANPSIARRAGAISHLSDRPARETEAEGRLVSRQSPEAYRAERPGEALGRWPANVALDEAAAAALDQMSGSIKSRNSAKGIKNTGSNNLYSAFSAGAHHSGYRGEDSGASRFFYVAKASRRERGPGCTHPTVKPLALMQWLVRLVTPPDGIVLDPFLGSGTTGIAAQREGFSFIGIEREAEYIEIARRRIAADAPLLSEAAD